ncbi:MAG TPA: organic hydroperoxide resistance protein [Hyphomonadaceae bacterium]|nr:organic hydroperoxide resistance protein [Hyphomonadaceae bacterium]HVZ15080.1 organic hydroperoxide resistance protein [Bauldia sp.]
MTVPEQLIYTGKVRTMGGRENGVARSSDGRLDIRLTPPGVPGSGTNPEQLLAAGWSACFEGAMGIAAKSMHVALPGNSAIDAEVDLNLAAGGYFLRARLRVSLPGVEPAVAREIVEQAHRTCPYSKAMSGNIDISIELA